VTCLEATTHQLAGGWIQHDPVRTFVCSSRRQVCVITHLVCLDMAPRVHALHTAHVQQQSHSVTNGTTV